MNQDILIVSSQDEIVIPLDELLLKYDYNVLATVQNEDELFTFLENNYPAVVLLDNLLIDSQYIYDIVLKLKQEYEIVTVLIYDGNCSDKNINVDYSLNKITFPYVAKDVISALAIAIYQRNSLQIVVSEQNLFLDTISLHVWILKEPDKFKSANEVCANFFGLEKEKMINTKFDEFLLSNDASIELKENEKIYRSKRKLTVERWITGKNGTKRFFAINKVPNVDENGDVHSVVCSARDITDERMLENKIRQKQKMESVGQLASGIAHDFNNMLTIINGYSDMLLRKLDDPEKVEIVKEIIDAGERAANLTTQLLAFSRRQIIKLEVVSVSQLISALSNMLKRLIGEHIEFVYKLDEDVTPITIDPTQLEQIVINLVVNARDAIENSGKLIVESRDYYFDKWYCKIHPEVNLTPGKYVMFSISDTGCGIKKDDMQRLYEPFFTTKPQGKGTGMGLATVYGIVKQNNGFIWVYSEVGLGTTFKVYFPASDGYLSSQEESLEEHISSYDAKGETVLIVEDEEEIGNLIVEMLKERGYKVYFVTHPHSAITLFEKHASEIDLLISDVVMPILNGRDLYDELVKIKPKLPVVFISGYSEDIITRYGISNEKYSFVQKPIHTEEFLKELRVILD